MNLKRRQIPAHIVEQGETLTSIAHHELGDVRKWKALMQMNKITSPEFIRPGDILILPGRPVWM